MVFLNSKKSRLYFLIAATLAVAGCSNSGENSSTKTSTSSTTASSAELAESAATKTDGKYGSYTDEDLETAYDKSSATKITLNGSGVNIEGDGAKASDTTITISSGGTYIVSGTLDDGQIIVTANADADTVHIILDGVDLTSSTTSPIYVEQAEKVILTLAEDSKNTLTDANDYVYADSTQDEPDAVIFSKDDLTLNGSGKLTIKGNYNNGIRSKDDLVITGGTYNITAPNNGLKGKDSVSILDGTFTITSDGDAIQANNTEGSEKGWVAIDGGSYTLTAGNDGIQAETNLSISTAKITVTAGGGSNASVSDSKSYKGLKAGTNIQIDKGTFDLDTADDSLHANGNVTIDNGNFTISTGDDGIHADAAATINNGTVTIEESYEGIEGATIVINDGTIDLTSSDDGMNAAGGSDGSSEGGGNFGPDSFSSSGDYSMTINGGYIGINAAGDGVDSNGDITMTSGTLLVSGPTGNGNGALDYDGTFDIKGGTFIAAGSSGMAMAPSDSSSQAAISLYFNSTQSANTLVNISDESGNSLVTFSPKKDFQHIVISIPDLKEGSSYIISSGGTDSGTNSLGLYTNGTYSGTKLVTTTLASVITSIDESGSTISGSQMGGGRK